MDRLFIFNLDSLLKNTPMQITKHLTKIPMILSFQILYNVLVRNNSNRLIIVFSIASCIYLFYRFNGYSKSVCGNKFSSPIWGSNELKLWELILFALIIFYPRWLTLASILVIFPLIYWIGGGYGSLWCAISTLTAFYILYKAIQK